MLRKTITTPVEAIKEIPPPNLKHVRQHSYYELITVVMPSQSKYPLIDYYPFTNYGDTTLQLA